VKKVSNVCVNISESGMMIKKYLGIAQSTIGHHTQQMRLGISALFGKMRIHLSLEITELQAFMSVKRMSLCENYGINRK
jgi:hypothetical protein